MGDTEGLRNLCYADPTFADRYDGWEEVGDGGAATVVKVRGKHDGAVMALKVFRHLPEDFLPRCQREVNAARRLRSDFAVRTYSFFAQGSLCWFEMEFVEGSNLKTELQRRQRSNEPFPFTDALDIAVATASAIADAHRIGLIHRDIKPDNILLPATKLPAALITDFGIARMRDDISLTLSDRLLGTPMYTSPEAAAGRAVTKASDIYSLALCLYRLFTNWRYPYEHDPDTANTMTFLDLHANPKHHPTPIRTFDPTLPDELEDLLGRCLVKENPDRRPDAAEVLAALRRLREAAARATPAPARPRLSRRQASIAAAAGFALLLAGTLLLRGNRADTQARATATTLPPIDTQDPSLAPIPAPSTLAPRPSTTAPATAATATNSAIRASLSGHFLRVLSAQKLGNATVVLVGKNGSEHSYTIRELEPDEVAFYPLDRFSPAIVDDSLPARELRITVQAPDGPRTVKFNLS